VPDQAGQQSKLFDALATAMSNSTNNVLDTLASNASSASASVTPSASRGNARILVAEDTR